jgi:hypothetical protein
MIDEKENQSNRKVYAKGYFDGLKKANEMTPSKFAQKMQNQTTIAKKVYEAVPIAESWSVKQILSEMFRVTRSQADHKIVNGCIKSLIDSGLVYEPINGQYQRAQVKEKAIEPEKIPLKIVKEKGIEMDVTIKKEPDIENNSNPIDVLGKLSSRLLSVNRDIKKIADDIDSAAISVQEQLEESEGKSEKLKQLQQLLKSLG